MYDYTQPPEDAQPTQPGVVSQVWTSYTEGLARVWDSGADTLRAAGDAVGRAFGGAALGFQLGGAGAIILLALAAAGAVATRKRWEPLLRKGI